MDRELRSPAVTEVTVTAGPVEDVLRTIDDLRTIDQENITKYTRFAVGIVMLGIAVMAVAYSGALGAQPAVMEALVGLGGLFISSLGGFPFTAIMTRRDRMRLLTVVRRQVCANPERVAEYAAQINKLIWKRLEA